jgi:proteasome lid subunit RPN8/RPN11
MRRVTIPDGLVRRMGIHARATYPDECCGFLLGSEEDSDAARRRAIESVEPAANEFDGERRRRFVIAPAEIRAIERRLEGTARSVIGFYHSHPDHPARPSEFDRDHAWPWYTYVVLSVTKDEVPAVGAFELDEASGEFRPLEVEVTDTGDRSLTGGLPRP